MSSRSLLFFSLAISYVSLIPATLWSLLISTDLYSLTEYLSKIFLNQLLISTWPCVYSYVGIVCSSCDYFVHVGHFPQPFPVFILLPILCLPITLLYSPSFCSPSCACPSPCYIPHFHLLLLHSRLQSQSACCVRSYHLVHLAVSCRTCSLRDDLHGIF